MLDLAEIMRRQPGWKPLSELRWRRWILQWSVSSQGLSCCMWGVVWFSTHVDVELWPGLALSLGQWPRLRRPRRVYVRESKGMCANYEPQSIPRLVFGLNSALASLVMTASAWSLRLFGQKPMGRRALFGLFIWIYKLDSSSISPDHPLLSQQRSHQWNTTCSKQEVHMENIWTEVAFEAQTRAKSLMEKSESKAIGTEKRRSRWLWERPVFQGEGGGMLKGSKRQTSEWEQMQDPKLPIRPIHNECCQEGAQQREEELNIHQHLA